MELVKQINSHIIDEYVKTKNMTDVRLPPLPL